MQEASLGDASCKCIICIIYQDININYQPSLTPCKNNQEQNCSCRCVEVLFFHRQQQGFLPASVSCSLGFPAPPSAPGEAMKDSF